jgi:hypothetical protein
MTDGDTSHLAVHPLFKIEVGYQLKANTEQTD